MNLRLKPIYLFADSQLLFWRSEAGQFLHSVRESIGDGPRTAAYIGASNGDDPGSFAIFREAMESIGISDCRMVRASFSADDAGRVAQADIILLAGGDVGRGWNIFEQTGLKELIYRRYFEGALLIGLSAGAVQLGLLGCSTGQPAADNLIKTFGLIPFVVGVHEENEDWKTLKLTIRLASAQVHGIGIPGGAGIVYHSDSSIEAIRHSVCEFSVKGKKMVRHLLFPTAARVVLKETADIGLTTQSFIGAGLS
jgi:cyanophycinase-like exopeptidase